MSFPELTRVRRISATEGQEAKAPGHNNHTTTTTYQTKTIDACSNFGIVDCGCCGFVGTVVSKRKANKARASKAQRARFCDSFAAVGSEVGCNGNCNHFTVTGYPPISKPCETSSELCNYLKLEFPQKHVSRRLSSHIALNPRYVNTIHEVSLDISESEDKSRQMKEDHISSLTRFEQSSGDVDDDEWLPLRSVFSYFF